MDFLDEENGMIENNYNGVSIYSKFCLQKYRLIRNVTAFTLCGTIFLNSWLPILVDRDRLMKLSRPYIDKFCSFIVPYLDEWRPYTNPKPENLCLEKEATVPTITQEELEAKCAKALEEKEIARQASYDARLIEYCVYFDLDREKVIPLARTLTENYTIGFENFLGNWNYDVPSEDAAILLFMHRLYRNKLGISLSDYGIASHDSLFLNRPRTTREDGEPLVLRCGDTGSEYIGRICDILGVDKAWGFSIAMLESGKLNSPLCRNSNNFGGIGGPGNFRVYPTPEAGIIDFVVSLVTYGDLTQWDLVALSGRYVNGNVANPSPSWVSNVRAYHYRFSNDMEKYFHMPTEDLDPESKPYTMQPVNNQ